MQGKKMQRVAAAVLYAGCSCLHALTLHSHLQVAKPTQQAVCVVYAQGAKSQQDSFVVALPGDTAADCSEAMHRAQT